MTRKTFLETLAEKTVLLFDGAMGTMLYARGIYVNRCYEELNLSQPEIVREVHLAYCKAGADCLETNTFGANRYRLATHGFAERLRTINLQGARLAREAAGDERIVAGSIGPLGVQIEPYGRVSKHEARLAFAEQALALAEGGVDLIILESFANLNELLVAIAAVKADCGLPVVAQMTIGSDAGSIYGSSPEAIAAALDHSPAEGIGLNCSVGPPVMLDALERMVKVTQKPISIQPNAGSPVEVSGRNFYLASAEYMAEYARRFLLAGARIVGGCCGTTPETTKAMAKAIRSLVPKNTEATIAWVDKPKVAAVATIPLAEKSHLAGKLARGEFVSSVEIVPPHGCDAGKVLQAARRLKEQGVDAVNVPDGPRALARMGAQHLSILIHQQVGIEPVLHYACRDRNLLGMMSDFLGLYAMGIRNVLMITGDPPKMGDYPDATAVFDVDSIGLTKLVHNLNQGYDLARNPIGAPTGYLMGVGVNPGAIDPDHELRRFEQKVKAGAEFAITQPVFDIDILLNFLDRLPADHIPILAGLWPLVSLRNAEFMNNEVPSAHVPDPIMTRIRQASERSKEAVLQEGLAIAREAAVQIRARVQGLQVSAPFGNVQYALQVLAAVQPTRPENPAPAQSS